MLDLQQVNSMHRCVDQIKTILQSVCKSQEHLKTQLTQKVEVQLQLNQISSDVADMAHSIYNVNESQDSIKMFWRTYMTLLIAQINLKDKIVIC